MGALECERVCVCVRVQWTCRRLEQDSSVPFDFSNISDHEGGVFNTMYNFCQNLFRF